MEKYGGSRDIGLMKRPSMTRPRLNRFGPTTVSEIGAQVAISTQVSSVRRRTSDAVDKKPKKK